MKMQTLLLATACARARRRIRSRSRRTPRPKKRSRNTGRCSRRTLGAIPALLDADRGEALWTTPRGPKNVSLEQCDLGKGAGQGRRRLRRAAALFRGRRPRHGSRDAHPVVHGEAAGLQPRRSRQAAASRRRTAGQGAGRDRDLRREQVDRHEVRRQARSRQGEGRRSRSARRCSFGARDRSISPAPPATTPRGCASGCKDCRT